LVTIAFSQKVQSQNEALGMAFAVRWLHGFHKLAFVTEKTLEIQLALLDLALGLICCL